MNVICHNKKIVFLHIPKTGGTTISKMLNDCADVTVFNGGANKVGQFGQIKECYPEINSDSYRFVSIVRNPYDRFISGWKYCIKNNFCNFSLDRMIRFIVKDAEIMKNSGFDSYLKKLRFIYWHVAMSQTQHLELLKNMYKIYRFEDFENSVRDILLLFGVKKNVDIPHYYRSDRRNYANYLKKKHYSAINMVFEEDFSNFGYNRIYF